MSAAPSLIIARTGVMPVPMISLLVMSAPTQWVMSMNSWEATPGMKYLVPPEMPTTSWGKTGPTTIATSDSTTCRLMRMSAPTSSRPSDSCAIRSPSIHPTLTSMSGSAHSWLTTRRPG